MFELDKIQVEHKEEKAIALIGLHFHSYSPWENNPKFDECIFQLHGIDRLKFSQLQKIMKLFKPHDILIHLNPRDEPIGAEFVSLLFARNNSASKEQMTLISSLKKYCGAMKPDIATEGEDWTDT